MRYVMLVYVDESVEVGPTDMPTSWVREMDDRGVRKFGSRLRPVGDATTVRLHDEAIEVASKHPGAKGGAIEVRPLWEE